MLSTCYTKINLGLNILGKRSDGYHELQSFFIPLPFGDILELELAEKSDLVLYGISIPGNKEDNLVWKAWCYMQKKFNLPHVIWHLYKNVPAGTGIGAGSGDLAEMCLMCNVFFKLGLSRKDLEEIALKFGSDTGFFVCKQISVVRGRGDIIEPVEDFIRGKYLVLIQPKGLTMSTVEAFASVRDGKVDSDLSGYKDFSQWKSLTNDFQGGFLKKHPQVGELFEELQNMGAIYTSLSGSGSCIYGIYDHPPIVARETNLNVLWTGKLGNPTSALCCREG
ncbi:4-(cytidine 5'-diphospho)-2-C-methyl-D-erythritol kinase [Luteibaculum oceani]|uniref:4-diphosphocytidyl-2-C-methyl-D-erythritol kinase n=1 Tax=Luteibaculum oceani TaxID=1294296 RepID=A0A5C6VEI6_9FLAO|nr:4-(cytidine 5'-diphospho)-2-C-methyl-D-erythritol kinase [Luteibaculum oceani]TXC81548.1 4-(cytidine 5'-diphospho)-2-C-methyl-D-erythritol kinase [Luteibaculum oceani]